MKIYIASSWKNENFIFRLAQLFRSWGHKVDAFVDDSTGRYVFDWREIVENKELLNVKSFLKDQRAKKAFKEDKKWLDWCDCCVLLVPAGESSHLEGGYVKGQKKKLVIFAFRGFEPGQFDVMYGFADLLTDDIDEVKSFLRGVVK